MTSALTVPVRVTLALPRQWTEQYPTAVMRQEALRAQGLLPDGAGPLRWRVDHVSAGYLVEFEVIVPLGEAG